MAYRTIKVNNKSYKFVVGKQFTKIKGIGLFKNSEIGTMTSIPEYCECCGTPLSELYPTHVDDKKLAVTPANVSSVIREYAK
jgi:hypothetical protein